MEASPEKVSAHRSNIKGILDSFKPDFEKIEQVLNRHFASHIPFVNEVSQYILFAGGKRLRPLLTVCAARLFGKDDEAVFDLSVVPEYLHAASLLHDDVVDGGVMRRGKSPAYKIWGNKATVLVGDFLYARAIELASQFGDTRIAKAIAETVALMSEGEI
ncbi:MAG: polyprenyl synthetase family protein, partial [Deltaproteobacteria bacterium]|nr:polyprenyl synthetase family protein [Deltaproteobacteria bacterium]